MSDELKPCPFCGQARARFTTEPSTDGVGKYMRLECIDCKSGTMPFHFYEDDPELRQHLRDRWNRRVPSSEEVQKAGEVGRMPGTDGFTMACFRAAEVPIGTTLYVRRPTAKDTP